MSDKVHTADYRLSKYNESIPSSYCHGDITWYVWEVMYIHMIGTCNIGLHTHTHTHYIYSCVCVCYQVLKYYLLVTVLITQITNHASPNHCYSQWLQLLYYTVLHHKVIIHKVLKMIGAINHIPYKFTVYIMLEMEVQLQHSSGVVLIESSCTSCQR